MNSQIITRIKLGGVLCLSSILLLYPAFFYVHAGILILLFCFILYKKALWSYLAFMKPISFALVILILIQMFTFAGIGLSPEGLVVGIVSALRILCLSSVVFVFMKTTSVQELLKALHFLSLSTRFTLG